MRKVQQSPAGSGHHNAHNCRHPADCQESRHGQRCRRHCHRRVSDQQSHWDEASSSRQTEARYLQKPR